MPNLIPNFEPGFRLIDGSQLNQLVAQVNANSGGLLVISQGAPAALTVSATLTPAQLLTSLLVSNPGGSAAASYQLPTVAALNAALSTASGAFGLNQAFDFTLVSTSTDAAEDATITTNTGWTLFGSMVVASNAAATDKSAGRFRARKVTATAWSLYRLS
jgi:hypothetical protein